MIASSTRTLLLTFSTLISSFGLLGCSGLDVINAIAPNDDSIVTTNILYGNHPRQSLDLYRPAVSRSDMPSILFLYGGSWKDGDKADYAFAGRALARAGFLVAVADYRVFPEVAFPDFVTDAAKSRCAGLSGNASKYGGRSERLHLVGHSAGAHIAAMIALDRRYLEAEGLTRASLSRWVGLAGPYAFYPSDVNSVKAIFAHLADENQARPISFVDAHAPSALLLHGTDDSIVVPMHSEKLAAALNAAGVKSAARIYDGIGHVKLILSISQPFTGFAPSLADITRFLKTGAFPETPSIQSH